MDQDQEPEGGELRPEARLGAALRQAREEEGISLRALAKRLNYSAHSNLVEYERGHRLAPLEVVRGYEVALGLAPGTLVDLHEQARFALYGEDGFRRQRPSFARASRFRAFAPAWRHRRVLLVIAVTAVVAILGGILGSILRRDTSVIVAESFGDSRTNNPHWLFAGSAVLTDEGDGWLRLTSKSPGQNGMALLDERFSAPYG
jgi:transcriptional regulator with XRE-family HTH domain